MVCVRLEQACGTRWRSGAAVRAVQHRPRGSVRCRVDTRRSLCPPLSFDAARDNFSHIYPHGNWHATNAEPSKVLQHPWFWLLNDPIPQGGNLELFEKLSRGGELAVQQRLVNCRSEEQMAAGSCRLMFGHKFIAGEPINPDRVPSCRQVKRGQS